MAYLTGGGDEFAQAIKRGKGRFRSGDLNRVVATIEKYQKKPTAERCQKIRRRLAAWRKNHPKEYRNRCEPIEDALRTELKTEYPRWGLPWTREAAVPQNHGRTDAAAFVGAVKTRLEELGDLACGDAFFGSPYNKQTDTHDFPAEMRSAAYQAIAETLVQGE